MGDSIPGTTPPDSSPSETSSPISVIRCRFEHINEFLPTFRLLQDSFYKEVPKLLDDLETLSTENQEMKTKLAESDAREARNKDELDQKDTKIRALKEELADVNRKWIEDKELAKRHKNHLQQIHTSLGKLLQVWIPREDSDLFQQTPHSSTRDD